jgi:hypothetical protein
MRYLDAVAKLVVRWAVVFRFQVGSGDRRNASEPVGSDDGEDTGENGENLGKNNQGL